MSEVEVSVLDFKQKICKNEGCNNPICNNNKSGYCQICTAKMKVPLLNKERTDVARRRRRRRIGRD